jgi:hypothetical protein
MPDHTPWWPLRWEETLELTAVQYGYGKGKKRYYDNVRVRPEATVALPNGRRLAVIDQTATGNGYAIFTVDAFGQTNNTPTERVPDLLALRCFLQAEADA